MTPACSSRASAAAVAAHARVRGESEAKKPDRRFAKSNKERGDAFGTSPFFIRHYSKLEGSSLLNRNCDIVLASGKRTADIFQPGCQKIGTAAMGGAVLSALR